MAEVSWLPYLPDAWIAGKQAQRRTEQTGFKHEIITLRVCLSAEMRRGALIQRARLSTEDVSAYSFHRLYTECTHSCCICMAMPMAHINTDKILIPSEMAPKTFIYFRRFYFVFIYLLLMFDSCDACVRPHTPPRRCALRVNTELRLTHSKCVRKISGTSSGSHVECSCKQKQIDTSEMSFIGARASERAFAQFIIVEANKWSEFRYKNRRTFFAICVETRQQQRQSQHKPLELCEQEKQIPNEEQTHTKKKKNRQQILEFTCVWTLGVLWVCAVFGMRAVTCEPRCTTSATNCE